MSMPDELFLLAYLVGITIFLLDTLHYLFLGYGKKAVQVGLSTSLMYFGIIFLIDSAILILFEPVTPTGYSIPSGYTIFAIGLAIVFFGYNGIGNVEHSRKTDEILMHISYSSTKLKYKDALSHRDFKYFSISLAVWGTIIASVMWLKSYPWCTTLGIIFVILGLDLLIYNSTKTPVVPIDNLCRNVLKQLNNE
jgi:hypothetical protein